MMRGRVDAGGVSLLLALILSLVSIDRASAQLASSPWPMLQQNPQHTGRSPLLGPTAVDAVLSWTALDKIKMFPVMGPDGTIYVGMGFDFCAVNPYPQLSRKWCKRLNADVSASAAAVAIDGIYLGDRDNTLTRFLPDGTKMGQYNNGHEGDIWSSPVVGPDGTIYYAHDQNSDGHGVLMALNPDLSVKWKYVLGTSTWAPPAMDYRGRLYITAGGEAPRLSRRRHVRHATLEGARQRDRGDRTGWVDPHGGGQARSDRWTRDPLLPRHGQRRRTRSRRRRRRLYRVANRCDQERLRPGFQRQRNAQMAGRPVPRGIGVAARDRRRRRDRLRGDRRHDLCVRPLAVGSSTDGHLLWSYTTHNVITSFPMIGGNASPAGGGVAVLYVGSNDWKLYAIAGARAPLGGNTPPVASAGPDQSALVAEPVTFDATGSFDIDQDALSYAWSFGDGTFATGKIVTHTYQAAGDFVATVTVGDGKAYSQDSAAVQIFDPIALGPSFQDDFERKDSSSLGREWGEVSGDLVIRLGEMRNASLKGNHIAIAEAVTPAACQTTSARFASVDNGSGPRFGIVLRFQDPANFYVGYRAAGGASQLRLSKVLNGVETVLGATAIANPVVNSLFGLEATASGNTLTLSLSGTAAKLTVTDSTFGGGQVGILLNPGSGTSPHRVDDFSSGPCPHP